MHGAMQSNYCTKFLVVTWYKTKDMELYSQMLNEMNKGWTKISVFGDLHALTEEEWDKVSLYRGMLASTEVVQCWAVNVKGQMALFRAALPTFNANPNGGSFILTSSIAGASMGGSSMPYSITKAAQNHLMRCLAQTQGAKVRVNSVLPGLLLTEWGQRFGETHINAIKDRAVLKKETDLEDCADMYISIAKNSSMTGQRVQVDAGLNVGMF